MSKQCPICGVPMEFSALSRADNKTEICPGCGTAEGLMCSALQEDGSTREDIKVMLYRGLGGEFRDQYIRVREGITKRVKEVANNGG